MSEPMKVTVRAGAPVKEVHRALTDAAVLRVWLAEHAQVELPHRYEFWGRYTPEGETPRQRLLHADDRTLRFSWVLDGTDTTVEIGLEEEDANSTLVSLAHAGLPSFQEMLHGTGSLSVMHTYWALALANLVDHVEGRELTPRCDFTSARMREQVVIDAAPQAVYDSIVDPDTFARWFGAKVDIEPYVGGRWAMGGFDADPSPAKIVDLQPGRAMSIAWDEGMTTTWELEGAGGKTRITFVQSGFDEQNPPYDGWMGWLSGIAELRRFHELRDWRPMFVALHMEGMPEGILTNE